VVSVTTKTEYFNPTNKAEYRDYRHGVNRYHQNSWHTDV
jgi:hypothetical protein